MADKRKDCTVFSELEANEIVVSMISHQNSTYVATTHNVYVVENGKAKIIRFEVV